MGHAEQAVSVVMPVRNAMPFLDDAIASILAQTHGNFELILGDDGSTDGSADLLDSWARRDSRIRLIRNGGTGLGPSGSSNWVTREAVHSLIARMDADDISMPDRLRQQIRAFDADPHAVVVGSLYDYIDAAGRQVGGRDRSVFRNRRCVFPVSHGSLMFRRDAFERVGGYRPQCDYWEDIDLFLRMGREGRILVLPEVHYRYRYSPTSSRETANEERVARAIDLGVRCLSAHLAGQDYEALIEENARAARSPAVSPSVLLQTASVRLWRGNSKSIFRSWAWRHVSFRTGRRRAFTLLFAAWVRFSPASLRSLLALRSRLADWRARHAVPDGVAHVWPTAWRAESNVTPLRRDTPAESAADGAFEDPLPALNSCLAASLPGLHG